MRTLYFVAALMLAAGSSPSHSQNVIELRTSSGLSLSPVAGQRVNILNTTVPTGDWIATAKASAVNWGNRDYVRCILVFDGTVVDGSTTMTGEAGGAPAAAVLFSHAKLSTLTNKPLSFECSHDRPVSGQKIDPGATLVVTRVSAPGAAGPKGDPGPAGPPGPTLPTSAVCNKPTGGANPTSAFCSCLGKTLINQTAISCTVTSQTGSCSADGFILNGFTANAACCVCAP